jgi:hypothetical protein
MADKKISALTAATTPLAGTEVLPIVQSATTVKASIANIQAAPVSAGVAYGVQHLDSSKTPTTTTSFTYNTANISSNVPTLANYGGTAAKTGSYRLLSSDGSVDFAIYSTASLPTMMVFTNQPLVFGTNSANNFRLETTGDASVLTGNLVIGTSGKGIDFSATPGTGTSELLNDYEEGTFTPTYTSTATPPTVTYSHQYGKYTRIGRQVFFTVEIGTNSATAGTGLLAIGGLPFTSVNDRYTGTFSVGYASAFTTAAPSGGYVFANETIARLTYEASATSKTEMLTTFLTNGAGQNYLVISGSYIV